MTSLTFLRRTLPFLAAFLMASCGDPTVSYWKRRRTSIRNTRKKAMRWCSAS